MKPSAPIHPESLLQHGPRLRALARRLVRDDHAADDLVQETWVRAVERGPASGGTPWQWLARVLRNLAFQDHRLDARRVERERAVARSESGGDERQRFGMHRELVEAIERLEEPYRQAILLRYFDALPPRKISARLGVPVKTVKTRLNRGLALLRAALDREYGGREQWLAAMLPLARMGAWPWNLAAPALTAGGTLKLAAAALVAGAGVYWVWPTSVPAPVRELAARTDESSSPGPGRLELLADASSAARVPSATTPAEKASSSRTATPAEATSPGAARSTAGIHARVLDPDGAGLPGVLVGFEGASEMVRSGAEGVFDLPSPDSTRTLLCRDERFATVLAADVDPGYPSSEYIVVVAPAVTLAGVVLSDGPEFPGPNVRVAIAVPLSFRGRFRAVLDRSPTVVWSTRTDEQGRFVLEGAPGLACARLEASDQFGNGSVPIPAGGSTTIEIAFEPNSHLSARVGRAGQTVQQIGEVRHAGGSLAPGALVAAGGLITRSNEQALFEVTVPTSSASGTELVAVARGEQPARFTPPRETDGTQLWPNFVTLVLGPPARSIAGTVRGSDGEPLEAAQLWLEDLSYVGAQQHGFVTLEQQMAGAPEGWRMTWSGPDGRFELHGLLEREYRLAAMDLPTLQVVRVGPIAAGTDDVQIDFPADGLWARVRGRVVDRHGPRGGLSVGRAALSCQLQSEGSTWGIQEWLPEVTTDELGYFELLRVPREGVILSLREFPNVQRALDPDEDPLEVVIEVPSLAHLQIELGPDAPAHGSIVILDAEGTALTFYVLEGGSVSTRYQVDLANENEFSGGRTPALNVPDTASAVALRDEHGIEVRRVSVVLGEELTSVRL